MSVKRMQRDRSSLIFHRVNLQTAKHPTVHHMLTGHFYAPGYPLCSPWTLKNFLMPILPQNKEFSGQRCTLSHLCNKSNEGHPLKSQVRLKAESGRNQKIAGPSPLHGLSFQCGETSKQHNSSYKLCVYFENSSVHKTKVKTGRFLISCPSETKKLSFQTNCLLLFRIGYTRISVWLL